MCHNLGEEDLQTLITACIRSLREGNVFIPVCLSMEGPNVTTPMMKLNGHRSHRTLPDWFKSFHLGPPNHMDTWDTSYLDLLKLVHLGPPFYTSMQKRAVGLQLKGLLVSTACVGPAVNIRIG